MYVSMKPLNRGGFEKPPCRVPLQNPQGLHEASIHRGFVKPLETSRGFAKPLGASYTHIYTNIHISVFFFRWIWAILCKSLYRGGFSSLHKEAVCKLPLNWGFMHSYIHTFQSFLIQMQEVPHKPLHKEELCKAHRNFMKPTHSGDLESPMYRGALQSC